jgi:hypothetical protein
MCDGFRDVHPIQPDVGYVGWFEIMGNATSESVNAYLAASEAPIDTDADRQLFATIKTRYDACMNVEAVKTAGFQPVAEVLDTVAGLFPVDEKAYASLNSTLLQISDSDAVRDLILYLIKEERPGSPLRISPTEDDKDTVGKALSTSTTMRARTEVKEPILQLTCSIFQES